MYAGEGALEDMFTNRYNTGIYIPYRGLCVKWYRSTSNHSHKRVGYTECIAPRGTISEPGLLVVQCHFHQGDGITAKIIYTAYLYIHLPLCKSPLVFSAIAYCG